MTTIVQGYAEWLTHLSERELVKLLYKTTEPMVTLVRNEIANRQNVKPQW